MVGSRRRAFRVGSHLVSFCFSHVHALLFFWNVRKWHAYHGHVYTLFVLELVEDVGLFPTHTSLCSSKGMLSHPLVRTRTSETGTAKH
jgi:hypothetical protein